MKRVEDKDKVTIAYVGKIDNGATFTEVLPEKPLTVTIGESELPPTIELALLGMSAGETKTIRVPPDEGYGPRFKDLLHEIPRSHLDDRFELKKGLLLSQAVEKDGVEHKVPATIVDLTPEKVVLDYNHPLAGHHLTYELTLLSIEKA